MSNKEKQKEEELLRKCRQILGVSPNATSQEIKKAYHNLAQQ
jgi:curved DNA-binding protein CbpA